MRLLALFTPGMAGALSPGGLGDQAEPQRTRGGPFLRRRICAVRHEPPPDRRTPSRQYDDESGPCEKVEERAQHGRTGIMPRFPSTFTFAASMPVGVPVMRDRLTAPGSFAILASSTRGWITQTRPTSSPDRRSQEIMKLPSMRGATWA